MAAIVALAATVRCQYLGDLSYDFDEAFTWKMTTFPVAESWTRVARDNHPPLLFYLLWGWSRVFGDSPAETRSLNVVLGLVAVVGAFLLARQIGRGSYENFGNGIRENSEAGDRPHSGCLLEGETGLSRVQLRGAADLPALAAAALLAFSPYQVDFSQQMRMGYVLGAALTALSCWLLLRALQASMPCWRDYVVYALAAAALTYTHHFGLFIVAGQFLYAMGCVMLGGAESIGDATRTHPELLPEGETGSCLHPSPRAQGGRGHGGASTSSPVAHRSHVIVAIALVVVLWLPWAPNFFRQRQQVSDLFHTKPFGWNEVAKACYQTTLAVRWEDEPQNPSVAWCAMAAWLLPPAAMLMWGRGGLRLVGLCVLMTFDGAICASIGDRNIIQSRYFVFANALLLSGLPPLLMAWGDPIKAKSQRGAMAARFRSVSGGVALAALVVGSAWLCLAHAQRREGFARRPGMIGAMAYLGESRQFGEPVLVCNPLLQVTATAHAVRKPSTDAEAPHASGRALPERDGEMRVRVLSAHPSFPYFQGTAVMREEDYLSPEALIRSSARRVWVIDAVNWIMPELRLSLPQPWAELTDADFPEGAAAENGRIIVRCYERRAIKDEDER